MWKPPSILSRWYVYLTFGWNVWSSMSVDNGKYTSPHGSWKIETTKSPFRKGKPMEKPKLHDFGVFKPPILYKGNWYIPPGSLTARPWKKMVGSDDPFLLGFGNSSGAFPVKLRGVFLWEADIEMRRMKWETWFFSMFCWVGLTRGSPLLDIHLLGIGIFASIPLSKNIQGVQGNQTACP